MSTKFRGIALVLCLVVALLIYASSLPANSVAWAGFTSTPASTSTLCRDDPPPAVPVTLTTTPAPELKPQAYLPIAMLGWQAPVLSGVHIAHVEWDPSDNEYEGEYALIRNWGPDDQDMTLWVLIDEANHFYTFPYGFVLAAGDGVRVWTKRGTDTYTDLYWGRGAPVWNNDGDTAFLYDEYGILVDAVTWTPPTEIPRPTPMRVGGSGNAR
jgi:hypothetical protein